MAKKTTGKKTKKSTRTAGASAKTKAKKAVKSPAKKKRLARKPAPKAGTKGKSSRPKKAAKKAVKKTSKMASGASPKKASQKAKKKLSSPLSKKQLARFRALLIEKRRSLLGDMNGIEAGAIGRNLQESSGDLSNMPTHPADIGSDNFEHEFTLGLLESERALLQEINEALERIENGAYGVCLGTGEPIGLPRLTARPWCKYCIEYQKMIEKGLVRPGKDDRYESNGELAEDED